MTSVIAARKAFFAFVMLDGANRFADDCLDSFGVIIVEKDGARVTRGGTLALGITASSNAASWSAAAAAAVAAVAVAAISAPAVSLSATAFSPRASLSLPDTRRVTPPKSPTPV